MRSLVPFFALFGLLTLVDSPANAQAQKQHLEFVRGLRNGGLPDFALEYLDNLKKNNPPPEIVKLLPLEYARTWLELASLEPEEAKRATLISQARNELERFIAANPTHPQTIQANVELARLMSFQGKITFSRARRLDDPALKKSEMDRARLELKNASEKYKRNVDLLQGQIKALENDKSPNGEQQRRELSQFRLRSMIDQAINLFEIGESFSSTDGEDLIKRTEQFKQAKSIFEKVMYLEDKEPLCWVARAWAAESDFKAGNELEAATAFKELLARRTTTPSAAAGIRMARYFGILHPLDPKEKIDARGKLAKAEKDATDWLRDYPSYRNSPEGLGARYFLGFAKLELGKYGVSRDKENKITGLTPGAKTLFEEAQKLFKEIVDAENEYSERAGRYRSQILVTIADAEGHGDAPTPEALGTFERCYLMAQVQTARFAQFRQAKLNPVQSEAPKTEKEAPKETKKEVKKELKSEPKLKPAEPAVAARGGSLSVEDQIKKEAHERYSNAVKYLEYGLRVVNFKDAPRDVFAAQLLLVGCYAQLQMFEEAAVMAEYIARTNPKMPKAPNAAITAVQCYNRAQANARKIRERGMKAAEDPEKGKDDSRQKLVALGEDAIRSDTEHLFQAAQFMVEKYPTDSLTDEARHLLGFLLYNREKKLPEAWKMYSQIGASYPGVQLARFELGALVLEMVNRTDEKDPAKRSKFVADRINEYSGKQSGGIWPTTIDLLEKTPQPDEGCNLRTALSYLENRQQLIRIYQLEKRYDKAKLIADAMVKQLAKFTAIEGEQKTNMGRIIENQVLSSVRGMAYLEFEKGDHAKVAALLDPQIALIDKSLAETAKEELTRPVQQLRATQRQVLILGLQSAVQGQNIDRAGQIMEILDKSGDKGGSVESSFGILQSLVNSVRNQLDELEAQGKKDEAKALKTGFSSLLDRVAAKGDKLPNNMKVFIAKGYQLVESFAKCSEMLESIRKLPAPTKPAAIAKEAGDDEKAKFNELNAPYKEWDTLQHTAQFLLARNYRLAAKAAPDNKERLTELNKALTVLTEAIGTPAKPGDTIPKDKQGWGYTSIEIRKEKAMTTEEIAIATPATDKEKSRKWGLAVQEWTGISKAFVPKLTPIPDLLTPEDKAKFKTPEQRAKRNAELEALLPPEKRASRGQEVNAAANKRNLYFELWYEAKRCSVKAYENIGVSAAGGDQAAYAEKFNKFAVDFQEFMTKNNDLPSTIKDSIHKLIDETPMLKKEYKKVVSAK